MHPITPAQVTPNLRALFDPAMPIGVRGFAVLEGNAAGRILANDPAHPTRGAVWETISGALYLGGDWQADSLAQLVTDLRQTGDVLISYRRGEPLAGILPPGGEVQGDVLEFTDRQRETGAEAYRQIIPDGCQLRRMDAALFERCIDRDFRVSYMGSTEIALQKGLGFCLLRGGDLLSEAFAFTQTLGMREISVLTHQDYWGRGYGTLVAARLIQECEVQGSATYWNCERDNSASARIARKLGYRTEKEYQLAAWFKML